MSNRSANTTIKGYFYQFDHTIVRLLQATTPQSSVVVEGIEDVDLDDNDESALVQCKYYEGSEYNHSLIKDAVIQMLRHFHAAGCREDQKLRYRVYGHYNGGENKLPQSFDLGFLKKHFLTYERKKKTHAVYAELSVTDSQLARFQSLLDIDIQALSYDDQQATLRKLLESQIPGCQAEDAETFYYPNAINVVQRLAIKADEKDRKITKARFLADVNRKEVVFSLWLRQKFGDAYYARLIKRKHFKFASTKVPNATRIFVVDATGEFDIPKAVSVLTKLGQRLSHAEHKRTPPQDRFCPYVLLRDLAPADLVRLKGSLLQQGFKFEDGYPFNGSEFHPTVLAASPSKENQIQLKFIPSPEQIRPIIAAITGSVVEIFDFFKCSPLDTNYIPTGVQHHAIKVISAYFISEVL
jgi:hypothetical protein